MFVHNLIGFSYWSALVGFQYYVAMKYSNTNKLDDYFKRVDDLM